jgi:uncharacterized protein
MTEIIRLPRRPGGRTGAPAPLARSRPDGVFEGYASLFGRPDRTNDVIAPGAFARSLALKGPGGIRLLYQHLASEPIGVWLELREDATGLFARGRLLTGLMRGRETLALLREGAIDGLSIGFRTVRRRTDRRTGHRIVLEADLWEISLVTFPMQDGARITAVA